MLRLSIDEIIKRINKGQKFEASAIDDSFSIKISEFVPFVCTAIHDGGNFRDELQLKTCLTEYERWYEEDPFTGEFISSLPIVLKGKDSRFEYDLNRGPKDCIYDTAWGKKVWKKQLTKAEKSASLKKHQNYYKVTHALIQKLESMFDSCIVYDMHSYNYKRWEREVPVFNIGTENIDNERFGSYAESWRKALGKVKVPNNIESTSKINDTFFGRGYNLKFITENFDNTLVLATEVKKVFCDEETGASHPIVIKTLRDEIKTAILAHAQTFANKETNWKHKQKVKLLTTDLQKSILKVDREFYRLVKNFELLNFVNPINVEKEKKRFFDSKCSVNPEFTYRPIELDPFEMKRKLHRLEVEKISDPGIQALYEHSINAFVDKIDLLASLGTDRFKYNSMRYFGEPDENDLKNAKFLLHLPDINQRTAEPLLGIEDAVKMFEQSFADYGFDAKIEVSKNMVADAMVLNRQKKVVLKKGAKFSPKGLKFLVHHEIGVHMVTTMNSNLQPLKLFNLGLPINTKTQEGLAVMSEYLSGNITLKRLRELGLRVIVIDMMVNGADFKKCYRTLVNDYKMDVEEAFYMCTRVFRGGGFTKDFLYLRGFKEMLAFWRSGEDLGPLLIGKTSVQFYHTIKEMIDRGILNEPKYLTAPFKKPSTDQNNPIFDYIVTGIR